jgi:hypothetical protein
MHDTSKPPLPRRCWRERCRAALAYAARDPLVASVVVGADNPEQIRDNVRMAEDSRPLNALWDELVAQGLIPGGMDSLHLRPGN